MSIAIAILIGFAVNLDNFIIGINLGLNKQMLTLKSNIVISIVTGFVSYLATFLTSLISDQLLSTTNLIGAAILIMFGIYCLLKEEDPSKTYDDFQHLRIGSIIFIGLLLALNCIPPSFSAGILKLSPLIVGFFSGFFSLICMHFSNRIGLKLGKTPKLEWINSFSSLLLILIGIMEILI